MRVAGRKAATNERVSICINLREQLRIDELRELLEFCDQQWCCVAMRVGITLTPAPSTQIASTHELLEDDELTRIHDMAIDFRWIPAVGINIGNTGPMKEQPFQLPGRSEARRVGKEWERTVK